MPTDPLAPLLELPGVADGVDRARSSVDALLGHRVLRRRSADVSAESVLRGAWAAAWLAGDETALEEVRTGLSAAHPVVQGALRAYGELGPLLDVWGRAPRQALARLHALAAADLTDRDELGRPRPGVADRLDILAAVLGSTSAPAVVVAGVVLGELMSLDAFPPASTVVGHAAARLTLMHRGLDPKALVVVEAGQRELAGDAGEDFAAALDAYRTGTAPGIGRWLVHFSGAVAAGATESTAICEAILRG
jgi:hypothetical protein